MLRDSLLLSMLQQMLEDRDQDVRCAVVRALALLTAALNDTDKLTKVSSATQDDANALTVKLAKENVA